MIKDTSREAYAELLASGAVCRQAQEIAAYIASQKGLITRTEVSVRMGMPINVISGRVTELLKNNLVHEPERKRCSVTGRNVWGLSA